jgi:peptidoglycan/xylan/chitin deacetylase (PgdA/CDA1 family)
VKGNKGVFEWKNGSGGAVTLTYDDGLKSQLDNALPVLDEYGIKGTFFPSGDGLTDPKNASRWGGVSNGGHEIGSHTLNHPCDCSFDFVKKGFALQDYSLERMKNEISKNIEIIRSYGYRNAKLVFAYPCGESTLGEKRQISYEPLIKEMFSAARGVTAQYADPLTVNLYNVPCFGVECDGDGLISIAKQAAKDGSWAVFLFHGVGGEYISVSSAAHRQLVKYLHDNRGDIWTAPFGEAAEYIRENR